MYESQALGSMLSVGSSSRERLCSHSLVSLPVKSDWVQYLPPEAMQSEAADFLETPALVTICNAFFFSLQAGRRAGSANSMPEWVSVHQEQVGGSIAHVRSERFLALGQK